MAANYAANPAPSLFSKVSLSLIISALYFPEASLKLQQLMAAATGATSDFFFFHFVHLSD